MISYLRADLERQIEQASRLARTVLDDGVRDRLLETARQLEQRLQALDDPSQNKNPF